MAMLNNQMVTSKVGSLAYINQNISPIVILTNEGWFF